MEAQEAVEEVTGVFAARHQEWYIGKSGDTFAHPFPVPDHLLDVFFKPSASFSSIGDFSF